MNFIRIKALHLTPIFRALISWRSPRLSPDQQGFSSYRTLGPALIAVLILSGVEILILHIFLSRFSPNFAGLVTCIGMLGALYVFSILKSLRDLPTLVSSDAILARLGSLHELQIDRNNIAKVDAFPVGAPVPANVAKLSGISAPNVIILLNCPAILKSIAGKARHVEAVALHFDKRDEFLQAAHARLGLASAPSLV